MSEKQEGVSIVNGESWTNQEGVLQFTIHDSQPSFSSLITHYSLLITGSLRLPTAHCQVLNSAIRNPQFEIPSVSGNLRILFCYEPD